MSLRRHEALPASASRLLLRCAGMKFSASTRSRPGALARMRGTAPPLPPCMRSCHWGTAPIHHPAAAHLPFSPCAQTLHPCSPSPPMRGLRRMCPPSVHRSRQLFEAEVAQGALLRALLHPAQDHELCSLFGAPQQVPRALDAGAQGRRGQGGAGKLQRARGQGYAVLPQEVGHPH